MLRRTRSARRQATPASALDVSQVTRGQLKVERDYVDLKTVVNEAVETARPLLDAKKQRLDVVLHGGRREVRSERLGHGSELIVHPPRGSVGIDTERLKRLAVAESALPTPGASRTREETRVADAITNYCAARPRPHLYG